MIEIRTPHLLTLTLSVSGAQTIGPTPNGNRRVGLVAGAFSKDRGCAERSCRAAPIGSSAVQMARVNAGEYVDPSEYYFRTSVAFETAALNYDRIIAIGTERRPPKGPIHDIFEVL